MGKRRKKYIGILMMRFIFEDCLFNLMKTWKNYDVDVTGRNTLEFVVKQAKLMLKYLLNTRVTG